jgi:hypothetical protein
MGAYYCELILQDRRVSRAQVPDGDILIYAGDAGLSSERHVAAFQKFLASMPHRHKIVTFGNMDHWAETSQYSPAKIPAATAVLLDSSTTVGPFEVLGSPFTPKFYGSFQLASEDAAGALGCQEAVHVPFNRGPISLIALL